MKELIEMTDNYLEIPEANYALLINGQWGCGKTYFLRTTLFKQFTSKKLTPIYISLYGVSKKEDILRKIFVESNPKLWKSGKITEIAMAGLEAFGHGIKKDQIDLSKFVKLDKNKHILCFDDLERVSMKTEEVLGYINNFVEHDNIKTILIANNDEILKRELYNDYATKRQAAIGELQEEGIEYKKIKKADIDKKIKDIFWDKILYKDIKEKLIGKEIKYESDLDIIVPLLLDNFKKSNELFEFLSENKKLIIDRTKNCECINLRILKEALDKFKIIFLEIQKFDLDKDESLQGYLSKSLNSVIGVSLLIKSGKINKDELENISTLEVFMTRLQPYCNEERTASFEILYQNIFDGSWENIFFNKSILDFVVNGILDNKQLKDEVCPDVKRVDPIQEMVVAINGPYYEFSDEDFKETSQKLLKHIHRGEVNLYSYFRLFYIYNSFIKMNLSPLDIKKVIEKFNKGIEKAYIKTIYDKERFNSMVEFNFESIKDGEKKELEEYFEVSKKYAFKLEEKYFKEKGEELLNLFNDDFELFLNRFNNYNEEFLRAPIFKYIPVKKIATGIFKLENKNLRDFIVFIKGRYNHNYRYLKEESKNLNALISELSGKKKLTYKKPSTYLIKILIKDLTDASKKLEQTQE